ncbi:MULTISPECIES: CRISPR-associated endonuclease Cas2 [Pseudanabaena]|uniref:CRISPR-associated endoribonuclease Cas2 n=2 Tax=Pseudanabaena TaxID=1152 RepID=L8N1V8_9CYAN|nr:MULTISPECIES: CRISPR-associated endonuclease Cas2 [Pseudanabaena]ELS34187.1 CRISPR-associated protein, Cas2 family [Pseudanabaena biceps PCC 7429]MDG3493602.1 CRISPR-associated endonuclease Cas2 [Pseudanabaena catenata USMAC16]
MLVLVVYDIADDKRRLKLSNFLEGHGRRVQESVFECFVSLEEMKKLHKKIEKRVKPQEDNVRLYWIPSDALPKALTVGSNPPAPPPSFYII